MNKVNNVGLNLINRTIESNQKEGLNSKKDILLEQNSVLKKRLLVKNMEQQYPLKLILNILIP